MAPVQERTTAIRKQKVGRVVSNKMDKTVVVAVDYLRPHPLYRKTVRHTHKFYAHDEENRCEMGDTVRIEETRPLSKLKRWRVVEIVTTDNLVPAVAEPEEIAGPSGDEEPAEQAGEPEDEVQQ
jgi:small subunit ribosomal protein S17